MVVTVPFILLVQGNHEQVGAGELAQQLGGTFTIRDRVAKRTRHRPQYRGHEQKLPNLFGESCQDLLSQQADDVAVAAPERCDEGLLVLFVLQGEGSEVDTCRPPFRTLEQYKEVIGT